MTGLMGEETVAAHEQPDTHPDPAAIASVIDAVVLTLATRILMGGS